MESRRFILGMVVALGFGPAQLESQETLQLDSSCTVTIGNQTAIVRPDGSFLVSNISLFLTRDTGTVPQLYRARVTCIRDGESITGQSAFFPLNPGETIVISDIFPSELDPIPVRIVVAAPKRSVAPGEMVQLTVTATLPDGSSEDVTSRSEGTTYLSTNPALIRVDENGLLTGFNSSRTTQQALIAILNEGNLTTIDFVARGQSNDNDGDRMPNDYEILFGLDQFNNDANEDLDQDGLTNREEFNLGTIPNNPDTDGDGILDGEDGDPLHPEESPPSVTITSPTDGGTLIEGRTINFSVEATDDGLLDSVALSTNTGFVRTFLQPPFEAEFTVPIGIDSVTFTAEAIDSTGKIGSDTATVTVIPVTSLTDVTGRVVLKEDGSPAANAEVRAHGSLTSRTDETGAFRIFDVPVELGEIVVNAVQRGAGTLFGRSAPKDPVPGGVTNVGTIEISQTSPDTFYVRFGDPTFRRSTLRDVVLSQQFKMTVTGDIVSPDAKGWTFGIAHDPEMLELVDVSLSVPDLPPIFFDATKRAAPLTEGGPTPGFIGGAVLVFIPQPEFLPVGNDLPLIEAFYRVIGPLGPDVPTRLEFTDDLIPVGTTTPTAVNITIGQLSARPSTSDGEVYGAATP